jgi:hypothetical protein
MRRKTKRILDIEFNPAVINLNAIKESTGFSYPYINKLYNGTKKNPQALWKLRQAIIKFYGEVIKYVPLEKEKYNYEKN